MGLAYFTVQAIRAVKEFGMPDEVGRELHSVKLGLIVLVGQIHYAHSRIPLFGGFL